MAWVGKQIIDAIVVAMRDPARPLRAALMWVGIELAILARVADWSGPVTQRVTTVMTDDRGQYHVDVIPGNYLVGVLAATATWPVELTELFVRATMEGGADAQKTIEQLVSASGLLPRGMPVEFALLGLIVWKLGIAYWLHVLQGATIEIHEHYGGKLRNGLPVVIVAAFFLRKPFLEALPTLARVVLQ